MKYLHLYCLIILLVCMLIPSKSNAQLDVLNYDIHLEFDSLNKAYIKGSADLSCSVGKEKVTKIKLDLLGPNATKVKIDGKMASFRHDSTEVIIDLEKPIQNGKVTIHISYEGVPPSPSWFGGVYFSEDYIYNLGVTIGDIPHNYGKVWFPCVDNFEDKATYKLYFTVPEGLTAVSNGVLKSVQQEMNGKKVFYWELNTPIPTYLASFAISNYVEVKDVFHSQKGEIPIGIYVPPDKEELVKGSFQNLKLTLEYFERLFGPYEWERVGYVAVPMKGGAMEHATNVAYPTSFIDGSTKEDRLWAHELAHSWFGNLVTCETSGDMWLNEGFARYCEALYFEKVKGKEAYHAYMNDIQRKVLNATHIRDEGYHAIAGVSEKITYGSTVYDKGALVVHTLRNYLGDELFFNAMKDYLKTYKFKNASSKDLCRHLSDYTKKDLKPFFDAWVFEKGFPHFSISDWSVKKDAQSYMLDVQLIQRQLARKSYVRDANMEMLIVGEKGERKLVQVKLKDGPSTAFHTNISFQPVALFLDPENDIMDAVIDTLIEASGKLEHSFDKLKVELSHDFDDATAYIQLQKHFVEPSQLQSKPYKIPANQYWSLKGWMPEKENTKITLHFYLAQLFSEDKLTRAEKSQVPTTLGIFYRDREDHDWKFIKNIDLIPDPKSESKVIVDEAKIGDYALFYYKNR